MCYGYGNSDQAAWIHSPIRVFPVCIFSITHSLSACLFHIFSGVENEDVDTAAAIRHIEMDGEPAELGRVGPMDTTAMYGMDLDQPGKLLLSFGVKLCTGCFPADKIMEKILV